MKLPSQAIKEYQNIHFTEFERHISEKQAKDEAMRWLNLLHFIFNANDDETTNDVEK